MSSISQKADFDDVLRWERLTDLQVKVSRTILDFLMHNGKDTGESMYLDMRAKQWKVIKVSRAAFRKFADSQKVCSSRYIRMVMRKLVNLGFARVFTYKRKIRCRGRSYVRVTRTGYGLSVEAIKRYRVSLSRCEKYLEPLLIEGDEKR